MNKITVPKSRTEKKQIVRNKKAKAKLNKKLAKYFKKGK